MPRLSCEERELAECLAHAAGGNGPAVRRVQQEYVPLMEVVARRSLLQAMTGHIAPPCASPDSLRELALRPASLVGRWVDRLLTAAGRAPTQMPSGNTCLMVTAETVSGAARE
jgi:hypothetical protein